MMSLPVQDHMIITEHSYYSFRDSELLERLEDNMKYALPWDIEKEAFEEMQKELKKAQRRHNRELKKVEEENKNRVSEHLQEGTQQGEMGVARRMLAKGIDIGLICDVTGLRAAQVEKLATN